MIPSDNIFDLPSVPPDDEEVKSSGSSLKGANSANQPFNQNSTFRDPPPPYPSAPSNKDDDEDDENKNDGPDEVSSQMFDDLRKRFDVYTHRLDCWFAPCVATSFVLEIVT